MSSRRWVPYVAAGVALCIFGWAAVGTSFSLMAFFFATIFYGIAAVVGFRDRPGKYDLNALREVHEKQIARSIELDEPDEYDSVLCMCCGVAYTSDLPACPQCGKR